MVQRLPDSPPQSAEYTYVPPPGGSQATPLDAVPDDRLPDQHPLSIVSVSGRLAGTSVADWPATVMPPRRVGKCRRGLWRMAADVAAVAGIAAWVLSGNA